MTMGRKRTDYGFFATYLAQLLFYPILTYWDKLPLLRFHPTSHLYFFYCKICYNNINHTWNYNWIDRFKSKLDFTENWIILFKVFNKTIHNKRKKPKLILVSSEVRGKKSWPIPTLPSLQDEETSRGAKRGGVVKVCHFYIESVHNF